MNSHETSNIEAFLFSKKKKEYYWNFPLVRSDHKDNLLVWDQQTSAKAHTAFNGWKIMLNLVLVLNVILCNEYLVFQNQTKFGFICFWDILSFSSWKQEYLAFFEFSLMDEDIEALSIKWTINVCPYGTFWSFLMLVLVKIDLGLWSSTPDFQENVTIHL